MAAMLQRFIDSFHRAVSGEMEAMRQRMGPYQIPLDQAEMLDSGQDHNLCSFRVLQPNDKLVQGGECNLVTDTSDDLVTVLSIEGDRVVLASSRPFRHDGERAMLVIYPWFLYERLQTALRTLGEQKHLHPDTALALFGKLPPRQLAMPDDDGLACLPQTLNGSQQQAVRLCQTVTPAFVWGPPGTGKTTTLAHIILTMLRLGQRVLVTSTTNAAVDQALTSFAAQADGRLAIDAGHVVRLGQTRADTCGAGLQEVVHRQHADVRQRLTMLDARRNHILQQLDAGRALLIELQGAVDSTQLGLFGANAEPQAAPRRFSVLFAAPNARRLSMAEPATQRRIVERRLQRLEQVARLAAERRQALYSGLRGQEAAVVANARLLLATMTNVYMSSLLEHEPFDTVIVEEAGMAILPTLFYCACLASDRVVVVGDPQQLPPIVQSSDPFVQRAMGRSIFQITVPEPHASDLVVMLDTQYRMHPDIGDLVGELFYGGRLRHGADTADTDRIAAGEPCAGAPLVVVDTAGTAACQTPAGSYSRYNERHAQIAVDLARRAVDGGAASVAIIAPYVEQVRRIGRLLAAVPELAEQVECRTVHRFQGGERDVVIFDTVDADPMPPGRLLSGKSPGSSAPNLINVSLSRARGKLLILADLAYFRRHDPAGIISQVLAAAQRSGTTINL